MELIKATAMATTIAAGNDITKAQAFDMILAVATELEVSGTRFTEKEAAEIETIVARELRNGNVITLDRKAI